MLFSNSWRAAVSEIFMSDFPIISAQLEIYQRFLRYISATQNISDIFFIYRLTDKNRQITGPDNKKKGCSKIKLGVPLLLYEFSLLPCFDLL